MRSRLLALLLLLLLPGLCAAAGPGLALTTILDGQAYVLRDESKFQLSEGVALQADDILDLGDSGKLLRIEYPDGVALSFGPGTRVQLSPRLAGERGHARAYLLRGWAKVSVPPKLAPVSLLTPLFDATRITASAVLAVLPEGAQVFAEAGEVTLRWAQPGTAPTQLKTNEWLGLTPGSKPQTASHPGADFVKQVPRPFLDSLPSRAALFAGRQSEPKRLGDLGYADAQPWIDVPEPAMRRLAVERWRALSRYTDFRRGLQADMKMHPEWAPVLSPPAAR